MKDKKEHIDKEYLSEHQFKLYREGKMTPSEMRRVEGLLEKHPLYAEALEGFSLLDEKQIEKYNAFLQKNIQTKVGKKNQAKTVFLSSPKLRRIAAIVLVLIVFSFGLYFSNNHINKEILTSKEIATKESKATDAIMYAEDSAQLSSSLLSEEATTETPTKQSISETEKIHRRRFAFGNKSNKYAKEEKFYETPLATELTPPAPTSNQIAVQDSDLVALKKVESSTDDLPKSVPAKIVEEKVIQRESETKKERKKADENKTTKTKQEFSSGIVLSLDNKKSNYTDSLETHLQNFAKERNETLQGKLSVTFYLNHLYQIQNIAVKESPCPSCENEIIKWIQEYKHWQKYRTGQQSIVIDFD